MIITESMSFGYHLAIIRSRDDGGYYAEIANPKGETVHTTEISDNPSEVQARAIAWCDANSLTRKDTPYS